MACEAFKLNSVMPAALVPGIDVFLADPSAKQDVDGRNKPGHDGAI
jgi:hypothetical protein